MKKDNKLDVGEGYRIPNISEFKQGFKFERAYDSRMIFLDSLDFGESLTKMKKTPFTRTWNELEVWWMETDPNKWIHDKDGYGNKVHYKAMMNNLFEPFNVELFLKQGLIRVKDERILT